MLPMPPTPPQIRRVVDFKPITESKKFNLESPYVEERTAVASLRSMKSSSHRGLFTVVEKSEEEEEEDEEIKRILGLSGEKKKHALKNEVGKYRTYPKGILKKKKMQRLDNAEAHYE